MRKKCLIWFGLFFLYLPVLKAQPYYLRGEVKDEKGNILQNVKIIQERTGYVYKTGTTGGFGITVAKQLDSFTFRMEGYKDETLLLNARDFQLIILQKKVILQAVAGKQRRSGFSKENKEFSQAEVSNESYARTIENPQIQVDQYPQASLAIGMDKASYSNVRRFLMQKNRVPPDAVRVEEMINYFNEAYYKNPGDSMFLIRSARTNCPWNPSLQLLHINVSSKKILFDTLPASHLVFLIDVSISMDMPNRLQLLKYAFKTLTENLREKDTISIVVYGGFTGVMLEACSGRDKKKIMDIVDSLQSGGFTPGESGIKWAYQIARKHYIEGGNNRIILATDGDFNIGVKTDEELEALIEKEKGEGIYLTCLGVGVGNYKDSKMQILAHKGNGNFAYLDNTMEAEKVLVKELTQSLFTIADDVYMDVQFNPKEVKSFRLIGYENNKDAIDDSTSQINGGEIGSGFSMMALFEIEPVTGVTSNIPNEQLATVLLRYRNAGDTARKLLSSMLENKLQLLDSVDRAYQLSTAIAMYGLLLNMREGLKKTHWNYLSQWLPSVIDNQSYEQKEFLSLVQIAKDLYTHKRGKKSL